MARGEPLGRASVTNVVLVGVLRSPRDLTILRHERWYRIPAAHMPRRPFRYLAFYQPDSFGRDRKRIRYYARVIGRKVCLRCDLLPDEPHHVHARDTYWRIRVGKLQKLSPPIRNDHPRRVSFGFTALARLHAAKTLLELFDVPDTELVVAQALQRARIRARAQPFVVGEGKRYRLDFAIPCRNGTIAIECDNRKAHAHRDARKRDRAKNAFLRRRGYTVIRLTDAALARDPNNCVARVTHAIRKLGGAA